MPIPALSTPQTPRRASKADTRRPPIRRRSSLTALAQVPFNRRRYSGVKVACESFSGNLPNQKVPSQEDLEGSQRTFSKVTFGTETIHFHGIVLGDSPSVSNGAPLSIAWESHLSMTGEISDKASQRSIEDLRIPPAYRVRILLNSGTPMEEISHACEVSRLIRKIRVQERLQEQESRFHALGVNDITKEDETCMSRRGVKKLLRKSLSDHRRSCSARLEI